MKGRRRARSEISTQRGLAAPFGASAPEPGVLGAAGGGQSAPLAAGRAWPGWARALVSLAIVYHLAAVVAGALGDAPSSILERSIADLFTPYYGLVDCGYSYRFYNEPSPTPIVTATLSFGENRPAETVRLPNRHLSGPRMRHQRQLALANALFLDVLNAQELTGERGGSRLAQAYARHLCASRPGCETVTLHLQYHLMPEIDQVREATERPGAPHYDLFGESLFTTPEWIGEYPCAGL
jgi:hypothetical protein